MKLNNRLVFRAVDCDTNFCAACIANRKTAVDDLQAFLCIGITTYVGYPDTSAIGHGPQSSSKEWEILAYDAHTSVSFYQELIVTLQLAPTGSAIHILGVPFIRE